MSAANGDSDYMVVVMEDTNGHASGSSSPGDSAREEEEKDDPQDIPGDPVGGSSRPAEADTHTSPENDVKGGGGSGGCGHDDGAGAASASGVKGSSSSPRKRTTHTEKEQDTRGKSPTKTTAAGRSSASGSAAGSGPQNGGAAAKGEVVVKGGPRLSELDTLMRMAKQSVRSDREWHALEDFCKSHTDLLNVRGGKDGMTALHIVLNLDITSHMTIQRQLYIIEMLIDLGADPNFACESMWSPLHYAAARQRPDIVNLLKRRGADPNRITTKGFTPIHLLLWEIEDRNGPSAVTTLEALIDAGTDVAAEDFDSNTALHYVSSCQGSWELFYTLIDALRKTDNLSHVINVASEPYGWTPLHCLMQHRLLGSRISRSRGADRSPLDDLLHYGANLFAVDHDGRNVLHMAAMSGELALVRALVDKDPQGKLMTRDVNGRSPIDYAKEAKAEKESLHSASIVELLLKLSDKVAPLPVAHAKGAKRAHAESKSSDKRDVAAPGKRKRGSAGSSGGGTTESKSSDKAEVGAAGGKRKRGSSAGSSAGGGAAAKKAKADETSKAGAAGKPAGGGKKRGSASGASSSSPSSSSRPPTTTTKNKQSTAATIKSSAPARPSNQTSGSTVNKQPRATKPGPSVKKPINVATTASLGSAANDTAFTVIRPSDLLPKTISLPTTTKRAATDSTTHTQTHTDNATTNSNDTVAGATTTTTSPPTAHTHSHAHAPSDANGVHVESGDTVFKGVKPSSDVKRHRGVPVDKVSKIRHFIEKLTEKCQSSSTKWTDPEAVSRCDEIAKWLKKWSARVAEADMQDLHRSIETAVHAWVEVKTANALL